MLREEEPRAAGRRSLPGTLAHPAVPFAARERAAARKHPPHWLYRLAYAVFWAVLRPALALLGGFRVEGRENVPPSGPVLLAPNHASYSDPPIVGLACPRVVWFMTKAHLFRSAVLGPAMRVFRAFPVNVERVDRDALRVTEQLLARGEVVCVFPEGGVSDDGRLAPFKSGLALLALRAGAPVVPVALVGTRRFLAPGKRFPGFVPGGVRVRFGTPISLDRLPRGLSRQEQMERITEIVRDALVDLLPADHRPGQ